jgi:outer membrane protein assembly factor BamB
MGGIAMKGLMRKIACSLTIIVLLLVLPASIAGCFLPLAADGSTSEALPTIIPALAADRQNSGLQPTLVWIPQDSRFAAWGTQAVSDGWIACGEYYGAGNDGQGARLDYFNADGKLRWTYQRPLSAMDSCLLSAALRPDGSVVAGGRLSDEENPTEPCLGLLMAFDTAGQPIWERHLDYAADKNIGLTIARCLVDATGTILVVANADLYNISIYDGRQPVVYAAFSANGELLWQKEIDFGGMAYGGTAVLDGNGGFYLATYGFLTRKEQTSQSFSWLLHINGQGEEIWRQPLSDERYEYQVASLARDESGNLLLSCTARYLGDMPELSPAATEFHDRYRYLAYQPAVLLKLDPTGGRIWRQWVNGAFGAAGQDLAMAGGSIFWKVRLTDDIVKPYVFMSIDHRPLCHEIIVLVDADGRNIRYYQFSRDDSANQQIQAIQDGQPRLIGWQPIQEDPSWTEEP